MAAPCGTPLSDEPAEMELDELRFCAVCSDGTNAEDNELRKCGACGVRVHVECGGNFVEAQPPSLFRCRPCWMDERGLTAGDPLARRTRERPCVFCPNRGGAMVEVRGAGACSASGAGAGAGASGAAEPLWAHLMCVIWIPELEFRDTAELLNPQGWKKHQGVLRDRFKLRCTKCGEKGTGAAIQCLDKKCFAAVHPTCGFAHGWYLRYAIDEQGLLRLDSYCPAHEPGSVPAMPQGLRSLNMLPPAAGSARAAPLSKLLPKRPAGSKQHQHHRGSSANKRRTTGGLESGGASQTRRGQSKRRALDDADRPRAEQSISPMQLEGKLSHAPRVVDVTDVVRSIEETYFAPKPVSEAIVALRTQCSIRAPRFARHFAALPELGGYHDGDFFVRSRAHQFDALFAAAAEPEPAGSGPLAAVLRRLAASRGCAPTLRVGLLPQDLRAEPGLRGLDDLHRDLYGLQALALCEGGSRVATLGWNLVSEYSAPDQIMLHVALVSAQEPMAAAWLLVALIVQLRGLADSGSVSQLALVRVAPAWRRAVIDSITDHGYELAPTGSAIDVATYALRLDDVDTAVACGRLEALGAGSRAIDFTRARMEGLVRRDHEGAVRATPTPGRQIDLRLSLEDVHVGTWLSHQQKQQGTGGGERKASLEELEAQLEACTANNARHLAAALSRASVGRAAEDAAAVKAGAAKSAFRARFSEELRARELGDAATLNATCRVCCGGDSSFGNLLAICDRCDQGYHERCHRSKIDLGAPSWFCDTCVAQTSSKSKGPCQQRVDASSTSSTPKMFS